MMLLNSSNLPKAFSYALLDTWESELFTDVLLLLKWTDSLVNAKCLSLDLIEMLVVLVQLTHLPLSLVPHTYTHSLIHSLTDTLYEKERTSSFSTWSITHKYQINQRRMNDSFFFFFFFFNSRRVRSTTLSLSLSLSLRLPPLLHFWSLRTKQWQNEK